MAGVVSYASVIVCPGCGLGVVMLSGGNGWATSGGFVAGQDVMNAVANEAAWLAVNGVCKQHYYDSIFKNRLYTYIE